MLRVRSALMGTCRSVTANDVVSALSIAAMVCWTRLVPADSNNGRRSGCCRDRADVAHHAADTRHWSIRGNWVFPHYDPSDVGGVWLAGAP